MYGVPAAWHRLCDLLADVVADYLVAQIEAGVDAVQVFDSWVGALNARDYREFILPHTRRIFERSRRLGVPTIHFGVGTGAILARAARSGRRRDRRRLAHAARRGLGRASAPTAASRATSIRRCCSARSIASSPAPTMCWRARADGRATSSISDTASCRRRRSSTCRRSRGTCISRRSESEVGIWDSDRR